ncbi:MAG: cell division protein FtsL [Longimicrobiales bacterium]
MGARGTVRLVLAFALLLASLTMVVWRQGRALNALRELDRARSARALAESERSELWARLQQLESRARVLDVATQRLGMRVPAASDEIVILLRGERSVEPRDTAGVRVAESGGREPK